jgi:hypothetical protein
MFLSIDNLISVRLGNGVMPIVTGLILARVNASACLAHSAGLALSVPGYSFVFALSSIFLSFSMGILYRMIPRKHDMLIKGGKIHG